jgi:hypothetical protein
MLGDAPPCAPAGEGEYGTEPPHIAALMGRAGVPDEVAKHQLVLGEYISADIYAPAGLADGDARPALPGFSTADGGNVARPSCACNSRIPA